MMRLAHQFVEPHDDISSLCIVGMQTRGVYIAKILQAKIKEFFGHDIPLGVLDITFYRDDFRKPGRKKLPTVRVTEIPFDMDDKDVALVDDVLFTGRTVRSAMDALMSFGRPASIRFCCLVDRGHKELPVQADYVGVHIPTHINEEIRVKVKELDGEDSVCVVEIEESDGREE